MQLGFLMPWLTLFSLAGILAHPHLSKTKKQISMLSQNPSGVLPDMWYVSLVWLLDSFSSQSKAWSCKFTGILERVEEVGLGLKIRKCDSCCCCTILPHLSVPSDYYVSSML